jgi:hypothetical protein
MVAPLFLGPIVQRMHRSHHALLSSILLVAVSARDAAHLQGTEVHFSERMRQAQAHS